MPDTFAALADAYPAWWVDLLGEHNHVGGAEATRWLLERSRLAPGAMQVCVQLAPSKAHRTRREPCLALLGSIRPRAEHPGPGRAPRGGAGGLARPPGAGVGEPTPPFESVFWPLHPSG